MFYLLILLLLMAAKNGYKTVGWTNNSELIVEKWTPYYYKSDSVELKSGMQFNGTKIVVK